MEAVLVILVIVCIFTFIKVHNTQSKLKRLIEDYKKVKRRLEHLEEGISYERVQEFIASEVARLRTEGTAPPQRQQAHNEQVSNEQSSQSSSHTFTPKTEEVAPEAATTPPTFEALQNEHLHIRRQGEERAEEQQTQEQTENRERTRRTTPPRPPRQKSEFWTKVEKQFAENWTGILGAGILVVGIGFLGTYAALLLEAVYRFLMLVGVSGLLLGGYFYLKTKEYWKNLALWLRSSAAAIFLFACLGSGGIEGLQWIDNPLYALILLLVGVAVNLLLSFVGKNQVFAAVHTILSLLALGVAQTATPAEGGDSLLLVVGAIVTILGVALSYRPQKWDYHILLSVSGFFIFHLVWFFHARPENGFPMSTNLIGIGTVVLVSISAALVHYRELYETKKFEALPFVAHLINWLYFAVGLAIHSTGSKYKTIAILLGSVAGFALAQYAKKLKINWLYQTDTLLSQVGVTFGLATLVGWQIDWMSITVLIFVQLLGFLFFALYEKSKFLYQVGSVLTLVAGGTILLMGASLFKNVTAWETIFLGAEQNWYQVPLSLLIALLFGTAFDLYQATALDTQFEQRPTINARLLGVWAGLVLSLIFVHTFERTGVAFGVMGLGLVFLFLRQKFQSNMLGVGLLIFLLVTHAGGASFLYLEKQAIWSVGEKLLYGLPFILLAVGFIAFSYVKSIDRHIKFVGIYTLALNLSFLVYTAFTPVSPLIAGVVWLVFSIIALETAQFVRKPFQTELIRLGKPDLHLMYVGYVLLVGFFLRHALVHLQLESFVLGLKIRLWIELFALLVLGYWAAAKKPEQPPIYKLWTVWQPLFIEFTLIFAVFTVSIELTANWQPIVWMLAAFALLFAGKQFEKFSRVRFYALFFFWATAFQVAFLMSTPVPSDNWYEQYTVSGVIAIVLQFVFMYFFYLHSKLAETQFPVSLKAFERWAITVAHTFNPWVLYPMIFCVGAFLFFEFDRGILTLLWVVECLGIFILSLILRDNQFRYVALIGIVLCVIRLIGYDMAQASILLRAVVFVGVGVIMLGMNALYNKYKGRFEKEEDEEGA